MKTRVRRNINKVNLHTPKHIKKFINKSIFVIVFTLFILLLKRININPTNNLLGKINQGIGYEFHLVKDTKGYFEKFRNLLDNSSQALQVFNPIRTEKYPSPIEGVIKRNYIKGENTGVDIQSTKDEEPKAITDGIVKSVDFTENQGYFVTVKKKDMEIIYGYLSKPFVAVDEEIETDTSIGVLGTNQNQEKYLRLEIKLDGNYVNPTDYIEFK